MIRVVVGDLAEASSEAVARSVGTDLEPCAPVDERIGARAGEAVLARLQAFGDVPVGGALLTPAGGLGAAFLIHLVVRSPEEPISEERVARALLNGLRQAADWGVRSIALPPLGTGAGNLDLEVAAEMMCTVFERHALETDLPREVVLMVSTAYEEEVFTRAAARRWPLGGGLQPVAPL